MRVHVTRVAAALMGLAALACAPERSIQPADPATFTGRYDPTAIDGVLLPTTAATGFANSTMSVQQGTLSFEGSVYTINITGTIQPNANPITLGTGGAYTVEGADGLRSAYGAEGRVWPDSAEVRTSSGTLVGAHRFRFLRTGD
jgi:hypothetical protein